MHRGTLLGEWIHLAPDGCDPFLAVSTTVLHCCGGLLQGSWSPSPGSLVSVFPASFPSLAFVLSQIFYPREERKVFSLHFVGCKMGGRLPGHCESVNSGEISLPFLQPGLKERLQEHWVKGRTLLWVRSHLRGNRRKKYAEVLTAGHNRDVCGTWYHIVYLFMSWGKKNR